MLSNFDPLISIGNFKKIYFCDNITLVLCKRSWKILLNWVDTHFETLILKCFHGEWLWHNNFGLMTKHEVKMAGYWPSFLACLYTVMEPRSLNSQKRKWSQYPANYLDLTLGLRGNFSSGTVQQVALSIVNYVLSQQVSSTLPAWVANHSTVFGLSCLLTELQ